jgi:hypothetical protein
VWGISASDIFAVGVIGTIIHYNGSSWSLVTPSPTSYALNAVWGSSGAEVFAVGANGTVVHYNGTKWVAMESETTKKLYNVWGSSGSNVFAVGETGTIIHYNGISWSKQTSPTPQTLHAVWGSSGSDVFAVGQNGTIIHYNGISWSLQTSPTTATLYGVWGSSAGDFFAVGASGTVLHYSSETATTSTTTSISTTTTTVIPDGGTCAFSKAAGQSRGNVKTLRQLRQAKIMTAIGALITSMYYHNMDEISDILSGSQALRSRFASITRSNMPAARELLQQGSTTMAAEDLLEIQEFLLDLQEHSGMKLRMDIDFILRGFESGWLLQWLGITVE